MADEAPVRDPEHRLRRRFAPLAWLSGLIATVLLVLSVNGTLAAWSASIGTDSNTVGTGTLALQETGSGTPSPVCTSNDATSVCTSINKYGGATLAPNESTSTSVTLVNIGSLPADSFTLAPGACRQSPAANGTTVGDLCGTLTVSVSCTGGGSTLRLDAATLTAFGPTPGVPHSVATNWAAGARTVCAFTVTLPAAAGNNLQGITATQSLTWQLTAGTT